MTHHLCRLIVLAFFLLAGSVTGVRAQTCTFTPTDVVFGAVDVPGTGAATAVGNVAVRCTAVLGALDSFEMRIHLGDGTQGRIGNQRRMTSLGTSTGLAYDLYQDAGRTVIFGGTYGTHGGQPRVLTGTATLIQLINTGINVPIYGRVPGGQSSVAAGVYQSAFNRNPNDVRVDYRACLLGLVCPAFRTGTFAFNVRAQVQPNCRVIADDLDFGTHGFLTQAVDATSQIRVTCTSGTAYSLGIGYGLQGTGIDTRRMRDLSGHQIRYQLHRNAARSQPWGLVADGTASVSAGTGGAVPLTVYGRVPAQTTPVPGNYTDTVVVTVTY